jgi:hypothetical protein
MLRTSGQLAADFPSATTATAIASLAKVEALSRDGQLVDIEVAQALTYIRTQVAGLAEAFAQPGATYSGAAGPVTRTYYAVPGYPLVPPPGNAGATAGRYLIEVPGAPVGGRDLAGIFARGRTVRYGTITNRAVAGTAATLSSTNHTTVTAPALVTLTGVTFDIYCVNGTTNGIYLLKNAVVAGATATDDGTGENRGFVLSQKWAPGLAGIEVFYDAAYLGGTRFDVPALVPYINA